MILPSIPNMSDLLNIANDLSAILPLVREGVGKLQPAGWIRPMEGLCPAHGGPLGPAKPRHSSPWHIHCPQACSRTGEAPWLDSISWQSWWLSSPHCQALPVLVFKPGDQHRQGLSPRLSTQPWPQPCMGGHDEPLATMSGCGGKKQDQSLHCGFSPPLPLLPPGCPRPLSPVGCWGRAIGQS